VPRKKLKRFAEIKELANIIEPSKDLYFQIKGKWPVYFQNSNPLILELGCGKGEYTLSLAEMFPKFNFIGIDIKGERIWKGATNAKSKNLKNVAFLRINVLDLTKFFQEDEVKEIWLTFPDPRPKDGEEKRRLTSPRFLELYQKILQKNHSIHLKTDDLDLYTYTLEILEKKFPQALIQVKTNNLYESDLIRDPVLQIQTTYEKRFLENQKTIKYLKFRLNPWI
jgi:tRNA (guanine-N7-)-methyltransferase